MRRGCPPEAWCASLWHGCLSMAWVPRRGVSATMVVHLVPEPAQSFSRVRHTLCFWFAWMAIPSISVSTRRRPAFPFAVTGAVAASRVRRGGSRHHKGYGFLFEQGNDFLEHVQAYISFIAVVRGTTTAPAFAEAVITSSLVSRHVYLSPRILNHGVLLMMTLVIQVAKVAITTSSLPGASLATRCPARARQRLLRRVLVDSFSSVTTCPRPALSFFAAVTDAITSSSLAGAVVTWETVSQSGTATTSSTSGASVGVPRPMGKTYGKNRSTVTLFQSTIKKLRC